MLRRRHEAWSHVRSAHSRGKLQSVLERAQSAHVELEQAEAELHRAEATNGPAFETRRRNGHLEEAKVRLALARRDHSEAEARLALYHAEKAYRAADGGTMKSATADQLRWEATKLIDVLKNRGRTSNPGSRRLAASLMKE